MAKTKRIQGKIILSDGNTITATMSPYIGESWDEKVPEGEQHYQLFLSSDYITEFGTGISGLIGLSPRIIDMENIAKMLSDMASDARKRYEKEARK